MRPILVVSLLSFLYYEVSMLKITSVRVPKYAVRGQSVRLECHYDLEGEALYSVKWYKNDHEFYRFLPEDDPQAHVFRLQGITVDLTNSSDKVVMLKSVDLDASGIYTCEVAGEAPNFDTLIESSQMTVVHLPHGGPGIEGGKPRYQIGEDVRVNCTSSKAIPAAKLSWLINGEIVEESYLRRYPILVEENNLQTSILGLEFRVMRKHFKKGQLKIKCVATIEDFYWKSNEESIFEVQPVITHAPENASKRTIGVVNENAINSPNRGCSIYLSLLAGVFMSLVVL